MGAAGGRMDEEARVKSYNLGKAIAEQGCVLVTGGCPGLPYEACKGAKVWGGMTIGISPGIDYVEHVYKYKSPTKFLDVLIYTGAGLMGREVVGVRSCDVIIIAGGRTGTLGEFSIAYDEGRPIGVLRGTGGLTNSLPGILKVVKKATGSKVIYDDDPARLVKRLLKIYDKNRFVRKSFGAASG
jgi:uncharacterized protein (TIGR00725 family)